MKRLITLIIISAVAGLQSFGQEEKAARLERLEKQQGVEAVADTSRAVAMEELAAVEEVPGIKRDTVIVEVGDEIFSVRELGDETRIKLGKKEFRVVENSDGVVVFKSDSRDNERSRLNRSNRFRGHLGGIEFGFNNYLTDFWSTSLEPEDYYLDLYTTKSNNWNFLLPNINIGFGRHIGIATTIGLSLNKYRFDGNNSIVEGTNGVIEPYYPEDGIVYSKTKLSTTYATLPIILEGQIPVSGSSHRTINVGAGVIGAVKLGSSTKMVYHTDGKQKEKHKDDYSLNTLRWGATARLGYEVLQVYGTCYFTSLFESGKGPELYPFEVGIALTFND
ncbi:MAG: PorT family protein [Bacteroidales bacterium]|jgi:hypothetical protein|nr:PorT family protein [Bacteroidales bacterium]